MTEQEQRRHDARFVFVDEEVWEALMPSTQRQLEETFGKDKVVGEYANTTANAFAAARDSELEAEFLEDVARASERAELWR